MSHQNIWTSHQSIAIADIHLFCCVYVLRRAREYYVVCVDPEQYFNKIQFKKLSDTNSCQSKWLPIILNLRSRRLSFFSSPLRCLVYSPSLSGLAGAPWAVLVLLQWSARHQILLFHFSLLNVKSWAAAPSRRRPALFLTFWIRNINNNSSYSVTLGNRIPYFVCVGYSSPFNLFATGEPNSVPPSTSKEPNIWFVLSFVFFSVSWYLHSSAQLFSYILFYHTKI